MPQPPSSSQYVTRFAPSPTGELHLGHVAHAAWVWGVAASLDARVILRIEDHDRGRCRPEYEKRILEDLKWLGFPLDPESLSSLEAGPSPFRQQDSEAYYQRALEALADQGLVYGCTCSRAMIAEEVGDGIVSGQEQRYPGRCRDRGVSLGAGVGIRVRFPDEVVTFKDRLLGHQSQTPAKQCGDLLIRDRNGNWTYQFCATVDDLRHGVTLVVRGDDLLSSTGRQILLARLLGREDPSSFLHHPLVYNREGVKLSKRDRSVALGELRAAGRTPAEVLGMSLSASGVIDPIRPVDVVELGELLLEMLPDGHLSE